jgi:hypothetical protein
VGKNICERYKVKPQLICNLSIRFVVTVAVSGLLLGAVAFLSANKEILGLFHDDGIYAVVGQAVAQGHGYRIVSLPTAPPQTKYPFVYSSLIASLWLLSPSFPYNIGLLKSLNVVILVVTFFVAVVFYRRDSGGGEIAAWLFAVLVCTNPIIFGFTDFILSDLLLVLLALSALTFCRAASADNVSFGRLFWLAAMAGFAWLTRTAALPLVFAGAVHSYFFRGWRGGRWFIAAVLVLVSPWVFWLTFQSQQSIGSLFAYYSGYDAAGAQASDLTEFLSQRLSIISGNVRYLAGSFDLLFLTPLLPGSGFIIAIFSAIGIAVSARRGEVFVWSFFLTSLGLTLVWPFHPVRYLAPLVPLLVLYLFRGMRWTCAWLDDALAGRATWQWLAKLSWSPAIIILLLNGVWLSSYLFIHDNQTTRSLYGRRLPFGWGGFEETFAWIRSHAPRDAVLATAYDPMYYLYTGRQAVRPALHRPATYFYPYGQAKPDVGTVDEIKPQLMKLRVDYLIIDPLDGYAERQASIKLFEEIVASFGNQAEKVFTSGDGKHQIYRIGSN